MSKEKRLRPLFSEAQLRNYFVDKLPAGIDREEYMQGLFGCVGYARLILDEFGGPDQARIYWIAQGEGDNTRGHAFVAPINYSSRKIAFNSSGTKKSADMARPRTIGFVRKYGEDMTQEALNSPWAEL